LPRNQIVRKTKRTWFPGETTRVSSTVFIPFGGNPCSEIIKWPNAKLASAVMEYMDVLSPYRCDGT